MERIEQLGAWPVRALWAALALLSGPTFADALDHRSAAVQLLVAVVLWAGWAAALVALLVPRSASLTATRVLVPAGLAAVAWGAALGSPSGLDVVALVVAAAAAALVLSPWFAEAWVDGSAYGPEQRTPLRTPPLLALVVAPATWGVIVAGALAGPLLLAARAWVVGGILVVVGWPLAFAGVRSLHQLARRWVVLVPAGLVVHDPLTMPEPQLFLKASIRRVGPAEDPDSIAGPAVTIEGDVGGRAIVTEDLTAGAAGLALELVLDEPVDLLVRRKGRGNNETLAVDRVLFTPSRPAVVLEGAKARKILVG